MKRNASNTAWEPARPALGDALANTHHCSFSNTPILIRAFRDWLLPKELEPWLADSPESMNGLAITAMYSERQRLRTLLTEQARIAESETPMPDPTYPIARPQ
jgi:hypothetical protein